MPPALDELLIADDSALVWTPARDTRLTSVKMPSRDAAKIAAALPFALEESVLDDVETIHFAAATRTDGTLAVALTSRETLTRWLRQLSSRRDAPAALCPLSLGLAGIDDSTIAVAYTEQACCVRTGLTDGFSCARTVSVPPELAARLAELRSDGREIRRVIVYAPPIGFDAELWRGQLNADIVVEPALRLETVAPINLLQGAFAPRPASMKHMAAWKGVLAVAASWILLALLFNGIEAGALLRKRNSIEKETRTLFASTFPDTAVPKDPARTLARNLESMRARSGALGSGDFLALLSSLASAGAGSNGATVERADYESGRLTASISLPNFAALERLRAQMQAQNIASDLMSAESKDGHVEARLRLGAAQ